MFPQVSPKQSFPALESEVLAYWKANNTFQKSIDSRPVDNPYRFYDGPPFITGTPHYGSLLSSIVKDVVGRYWTMRGKRVDRVWGWDCHGLPIEEKVQKKLGLKSNKEIEERGVKEFIDGCYEYTASTSAEWTWYIDKIGRWVDMDRAYRTMDQDYMESVMWVFSQLWNKGLIYEGKRVSLYSWKLGTPISNFEVAMDDTYQEVNDPAITVKFRPETQKACGIIVENSAGEILLGHNKKGYWSFPGGRGEAGETHVECAHRELLEETGIDYVITEEHSVNFEQYDVIDGTIFDNRRYKINIGDTEVKNGEVEKFHEWRFFPVDAFPENMFEPSRYAYEAVRAGKTQKNLPLSILAWTTTPWTIVANMALAVRNDISYVLVENNDEQFIVAKNRTESVFKGKGEYSIIREFTGSNLVGVSYTPPFPEYYHGKHGEKNHRIYHADFITDTDGTGIGHEAPEFGDVDFQLAKKEGIYISEAMDEAGKYTSQIFDYEGTHYLDLENPEKGANRINIERMKENSTLFKLENITHRVPFCPRSGTPLVQKAQASWFIDIQSQKDKLLAANEQINWFPEHLKHGRFAKGIESAPDWCISRTRYWGAPMPVWQNKDGSVRVVISSRDEIFEMNKSYGQLTKIIITRHAESQANVEKHYDDTGASPLSTKGFEQAEKLMQELKDTGVDVIITSPFLRAMQTAEPLAKALGMEIITDERLKELNHGKLANASYSTKDSLDHVHKERTSMHQNKDYKFAETGESYNEIETRIKGVLEEIYTKYAGKTVFVVSHGMPTDIFIEYLTGKKISKKSRNADHQSFILDVVNKNLLNLHKPYIDSILLANPKAKKAKKVLGIHGKGSDITEERWKERSEILSQNGIELHLFQFNRSEDPTYESWKEVFDTIDFSEYDAIYTSSLGGVMTTRYLAETGIKVPRIIMLAPGISNKVEAGLKPNIHAIYQSIESLDTKNIADEIVVLHAKDDETVPYANGKAFAENIGARFIGTETGNHNFEGQYQLIAGIIQSGEPLVRITEVLDVWMDSGSMPYAQMHYPFENKGEMEASFPADFIAEYVGQVRAWFYVMHVLGVLLNPNKEPKPTPSFTNVITTGVINGNDGRKMSKSYGNYPDPRLTIEKYGADPIRFYMLNSPLLSGGDMDFKEEQIIETVKGVMLPIWNTYSFFTTYANIDNWEKDATEVWFSRHGESTSNVAGRMSDGSDNPELTEKGREQARSAGKTLRDQGKNFDIIIHTSPIRADHTAHIIGETLDFKGEYVLDDRFIEQQSGEYAGKTLEEVARSAGIPGSSEEYHTAIRKVYKNNSVENINQYEARIQGAYADILEKYAGKKILIIGHSGTSRPIIAKYFGKGSEVAHFYTSIQNAEPFQLVTTALVNPLDRWIISKLQVLIGQVHDAMDGYDVSRACRAIVDYMDELTNWYVRLSRRRFWESGMTPDKASGYEKLHTVLTEVSKLLAPFMPFISESIFQGLTGKESVHLEYATFPNRHLIDNDLNRDMERCEHIVSLGLALRSRKNIRVRQPLASVTITENLDEYYQKIICDELNVKEIYFENPEKLAKKICKPDARKIGPKYGKDVQKIITEAKNGNFIENANGIIDVGGFILEKGEYTIEYLPLEGTLDVEGGYGMVVALDTTITEELKLEGYARDIIRLIQEMRKEGGYQVTDRISFTLSGSLDAEILGLFADYIGNETLGFYAAEIENPDIQKDEQIDTDIHIKITISKR